MFNMKFLGVTAALLSSAAAFAPALVSRPLSSSPSSSTALDARKPFISGNWKLNPQSKEEAVKLAKEIASSVTDTTPDSDIALFVPYVFIESAMKEVDGKIKVGAEVRTLHSTKVEAPIEPFDSERSLSVVDTAHLCN